MMHQQFDSKFPIWLKGDYGQVYYANVLPPGEFSGSKLNSPVRKPIRPKGAHIDNEGHRNTSVQGHTQFEMQQDDTIYYGEKDEG